MKALAMLTALAVVCCASSAGATDLTLTIQLTDSGGTPIGCGSNVGPGETAYYRVLGELSDATNQGLALFGFDLSISGPAAIMLSTEGPVTAGTNMANFVDPLGLNNPAGFGGTPSSDDLLQIGGGQNTILDSSTNGIPPDGNVDLNLALLGSPEVLASGSIVMPATQGTYTLSIPSNYSSGQGFANVVTSSATGSPFWEVEAVGTVTANTCDILVVPGDPPVIQTAKSLVNQGGTELGLTLIDGEETRTPGVSKMEIAFDMEMDETTCENAANVSITNEVPDTYTGTITPTLSLDGYVLTIELSPALSDVHCWTVDLAGMESAEGVEIEESTYSFVSLAGDADRNKDVTSLDYSAVKLYLGLPVTESNAHVDVNADGDITSLDYSTIKLRLANSATCTP